jgi:peptide/nickel transport system permease protein
MSLAEANLPAEPSVPDQPGVALIGPGVVRATLRSWTARVGLVILVVFVVVAVFGPLLAPYPTTPTTGTVFAPPGHGHVLGTDDAGVDVFSLLLTGARVSLIVGFASAFVAMVIGGTTGVITGYFGGRVDSVLMRVADYFLVIPDVPLMVVMAALFGRSLSNIILIIALIYWASTARLIRAQTRSVRERVFVRRARSLGAGHGRVLLTHVVPQIVPLLIANTVLQIALGIYAETFVTFLGLGDPEAISWGSILQGAFAASAQTNGAWWAIVPPGVCVTLVVIGFTLVGQTVEEELNPRLRVGHLAYRRFRVRPMRGELTRD